MQRTKTDMNKRFLLQFILCIIYLLTSDCSSIAQVPKKRTVLVENVECANAEPVQIADDRNGNVHMVGAHEGVLPDGRERRAGEHPTTEIAVVVSKKPQPITLILSSYNPVRWNVTLQPGAQIQKIIVSSYHASEVIGQASDVPIIVLCRTAHAWGPNVSISGMEPFYIYKRLSLGPNRRFELRDWEHIAEVMKELKLGNTLSTFQGSYQGIRYFV